jgi:hypothetical protein
MYQFKLLSGTHFENGITYDAKEDPVVSSPHELDKMFPNKFQRTLEAPVVTPPAPIPPAATEAKSKPTPTPEATKDDTEEAEEVEEADLPDGEDVSNDFQQAVDLGLRVFKVSPRRFNVYDPDDGIVNEKPLPVTKVRGLLKKLGG